MVAVVLYTAAMMLRSALLERSRSGMVAEPVAETT
jgi:hypothetical protein